MNPHPYFPTLGSISSELPWVQKDKIGREGKREGNPYEIQYGLRDNDGTRFLKLT